MLNRSGDLFIPVKENSFNRRGKKRKIEEVVEEKEEEQLNPQKRRKFSSTKNSNNVFEDYDEETKTESQYSRMPVSKFGLAMLIGMGFNKKEVEKNKNFTPSQHPKLAGLGSSRMIESENDEERKRREKEERRNKMSLEQFLFERKGEKREKDFIVNDVVSILRGIYEGLMGRVLGAENVEKKGIVKKEFLIIRLNLSNKIEVKIRKENVKLIDIKSLGTLHPARIFARSEYTNLVLKKVKVVKRKKKIKKSKSKWVVPNIRVRIVSKMYQKGKYFNKKGTIVDIPDLYSCSVQLDNNNLILDGITEKMIETLVPKKKNSKVVCVMGKYKGESGILFERNSKKGECYVQLVNSLEIVRVSFDNICESSE